MKKEEIQELLKNHKLWLSGDGDGRRADLTDANLTGANLTDANLTCANLTGATGLVSAISYLSANFEQCKDGYIAYKTFGAYHNPPASWSINPGNEICETANSMRTDTCGSGINVAPLEWVKQHASGNAFDIWKVLIRWEWLPGVVVPYNTDGRIRCEKVQLIEIVR